MTESELQKAIETTQPIKEEKSPVPQEQNFDPLNPFLTILNLLNRPRNYLSAAPTFVPQNLVDQIQFVDDGVDKWIYVYVNKTWVGIKSGVSGAAGGSNTQLQRNNAGAFGGITGATSNGTEVTLNQPTISSFASSQHDHSNGSQGGQLNASSVFNLGTVPVARLPIMLGDGGSGGTEGLVPTPAAGDGTKYLRGDGTWETPPTAGFSSRVRAYLGTNYDIDPSTDSGKLNFDTVEYDGLNEYDETTNFRFTAADDGYYLVICKVQYDRASGTSNDTNNDYLEIIKNGNPADILMLNPFVQRSLTGTFGAPFAMVQDIISLTAGDYIEAFINLLHNGNNTIESGQTVTYISIHRLS